MTPSDVREQILAVDGLLNKNKPVEPEKKKIIITKVYSEKLWGGPQPTPLPKVAIDAFGLEDKTGDNRWSDYFLGNPRALGVYRSRVGFYWLLYHDGVAGDHVLEHVGAAGEAEKRFKKK